MPSRFRLDFLLLGKIPFSCFYLLSSWIAQAGERKELKREKENKAGRKKERKILTFEYPIFRELYSAVNARRRT